VSHRPRARRIVLVALILVVALCLLAVPALAAASTPDHYLIEGVPLYQQIQAHGCGAAATQMVLNYWGPFVDQKQVYDAARTWKGSSMPDLARAGQLSSGSWMMGDFFPSAQSWGYTNRGLGYGSFYYASATPWLAQLKAVVAQGYPVVCLTDWFPSVYGPHYRVVVGYDDAEGVVILNDPWGRELKGDMDYQGSGNQNAAYDRQGNFAGWKWSYADFLSVWGLSTDHWGVPGLNYGAVLIAPWKVTLAAPTSVQPGETFTVAAHFTYSCAAPFATGGFPGFTAQKVWTEFGSPRGFTSTGQTIALNQPLAAGESATLLYQATAGSTPGDYAITATASGLVSGSLGTWRSYPAYDYSDRVGGSDTVSVHVGD
jgi:hypothetical protein